MSKCTPCQKKSGKQIIKINDITRLNHYVRSSQLNMLPIKFQFYSHYIKVPFLSKAFDILHNTNPTCLYKSKCYYLSFYCT